MRLPHLSLCLGFLFALPAFHGFIYEALAEYLSDDVSVYTVTYSFLGDDLVTDHNMLTYY